MCSTLVQRHQFDVLFLSFIAWCWTRLRILHAIAQAHKTNAFFSFYLLRPEKIEKKWEKKETHHNKSTKKAEPYSEYTPTEIINIKENEKLAEHHKRNKTNRRRFDVMNTCIKNYFCTATGLCRFFFLYFNM